jgi:sphingolipid delta-4 desaturase
LKLAIDKSIGGSTGSNQPERPVAVIQREVSSNRKTDVIQRGEQQPGTTDYYWSSTDEPHASRRREILAKYPEIKKLYGPDPYFKYVVSGVVLLQCCVSYLSTNLSTWQYLLAAYVIGGTANHMLMLAMHELAHNLAFKNPIYNRWFGLFANLPLGVPSCATFRKYHLEHHRYQGTDGVDVDIPTPLEGRFFCTKFRKLLFVTFQIFFYALRPGIIRPKVPGFWEYMNWIVQMSFDLVVLYLGGKKRLAYFLLSSLLGTGLHPVAGHFISEHFVFVPGTETYSYYGFWNLFAFNVGYHNEHHDFPYVPGSRLPQVRAIAKEYYDTIPQCESWIGVLWNFIMDDTITGFSRVKRHDPFPIKSSLPDKKSL